VFSTGGDAYWSSSITEERTESFVSPETYYEIKVPSCNFDVISDLTFVVLGT